MDQLHHITDERYFTPQELASLWKCHPETVLDLLRAGKLKGFKLGRSWRIRESAARAYVEDPENQFVSPCNRFSKSRPTARQPTGPLRVV